VITEVFCDDLPGLDVELLFGTFAGEPLFHAEHVSLRFVGKCSKKSPCLRFFCVQFSHRSNLSPSAFWRLSLALIMSSSMDIAGKRAFCF